MATMAPREWRDSNGSAAEGLIYRKLRAETPEDWFAVHSVGLASHRTKPIAEIDFAVIGPFGVLCLEVKGGVVRVEQGRWWTNDAELHESPFRQAGSAAAALHRDLAEVRSLRRAVVGHAVLFPDVRFEQDGPGIDRAIVYDDRDLSTPIQAYLERVANRWLEFHGRTGDRFRPLSHSDRAALLSVVAPSFTLSRHCARVSAVPTPSWPN